MSEWKLETGQTVQIIDPTNPYHTYRGEVIAHAIDDSYARVFLGAFLKTERFKKTQLAPVTAPEPAGETPALWDQYLVYRKALREQDLAWLNYQDWMETEVEHYRAELDALRAENARLVANMRAILSILTTVTLTSASVKMFNIYKLAIDSLDDASQPAGE